MGQRQILFYKLTAAAARPRRSPIITASTTSDAAEPPPKEQEHSYGIADCIGSTCGQLILRR